MCRFLIAQSPQKIQPRELLLRFSAMAKKSKALDGDWQGDGWGVSWITDNSHWSTVKSLHPIWEDDRMFIDIPASAIFLVHARSASFPQHKNNIEFNQPYIGRNYTFVFNGLLKGVSIPYSVEGTIGAQKLWSLLQKLLKDNPPEKALRLLYALIQKHTSYMQAFNVGLSDGVHCYYLTSYQQNPEYYNLHAGLYEGTNIVCSEQLAGLSLKPVAQETVLTL